MTSLYSPLSFTRGPQMKNRFMLAPLTNTESADDGTLSEAEFNWVTMRAEGGFGLTMTCAANVQASGQGFPGQLGIYDDRHIPGLTRLAQGIKTRDSIAIVQIHHAGMRSPAKVIGTAPRCPSDNEKTGAIALTTVEVEQLVQDFVRAAQRAEQSGFDGIEIHGAHGYMIGQFLSPSINLRQDQYGGSPENRARILFEIIEGIRSACSDNFMLGVRISPERFGVRMGEALVLAQQLLLDERIDFLDMSLWDIFKEPEEEEFKGRSLISYFTELQRGNVRLGVAGQIRTPELAHQTMEQGVDWLMLGRAALLHHDFPNRMQADEGFTPMSLPVSAEYLRSEGMGEKFITYMRTWDYFVAD
ncbi:MAG: NADH:flavin oxidoreductase [Halieaceae bacterium]|jgi:2,4-dienoyl-CoA reductase-like NADH-dependent reductase (Old Yellow Enzyme family)|nr:NADH:flavin oxidoreductase [Halieaceae bacterium]